MQLSISHVAEQEWIHRVVVEGMCVCICVYEAKMHGPVRMEQYARC